MYCKYCGKKIEASTTKCPGCGAGINFNDGGQSFFDSNELSAWQAEQDISSASKTVMPKTRLYNAEKLRKTPVYRNQASFSVKQTSKEKRAQIFDADFADLLSSAKKLFIPAAAVLLAAVLIVGGFYVRGLKKKMESIENKMSQQNEAAENNASEKPENNILPEKENDSPKEKTEGKPEEKKPGSSAMPGEYKTEKFVLKIAGEVTDHPQPLYTIDGKAFVQIESVLKGMGYGQKNVVESGKAWVFDLKEDNGETRVQIYLDSNRICIRARGSEELIWHELESSNIERPEGRYVPAVGFFKALGYNVVYSNEDENNPILTVTKK